MPSAAAPAAGLDPSFPSVPALSTVIFLPAILSTHSSTNAELRPPSPSPRPANSTRHRRSAPRAGRDLRARALELIEQIFRGALERPVVCGVIAARDKPHALPPPDARDETDRACVSSSQKRARANAGSPGFERFRNRFRVREPGAQRCEAVSPQARSFPPRGTRPRRSSDRAA